MTHDDVTSEPADERSDPVDPIDDDDVVDRLPDDLNAVDLVDSDYRFPNNNRRRIPAVMYLVMSGVVLVWWASARDISPLVNNGVAVAAVALAVFGVYGLVAGRTMTVDESEALEAASRSVGFAVGHASAQQIWRGWWSTPTWRILLYSDENPPTRRGLALIDAVDGTVVEYFVEDNPELGEASSPWSPADERNAE